MNAWHTRTSKYFYIIAAAVVVIMFIFILGDSFKTRQVRASLTTYMDNLRDMVFMSTYDSLKKGNMKLFKNHLEEIGTLDDVAEFSLLNTQGVINYSSLPERVKQVDTNVIGLEHQEHMAHGDFASYYFPVETISYCSRCHADWQVGSINSYYKLVLSRKALNALELSTFYYRGFTVVGGITLLAFIYLLFHLYERRKHAEQLQLSASVFDNAVEAIVIATYEGTVERINPAFSKITGFSAADILGQDIHILDAGEINTDTYRVMREHLRENGLWSGELWNRRKNGEIFPARLSVKAVRDVKHRVTHFISIFYDMGAEKAAEQALIEMSQMKSEFISSAAHELRTPLTAIMGYSELVRYPEEFGGFSAEQTKDFIDEIYDRSEALSQIVDDLLDIGRIESGKPIDLKLHEVCLQNMLSKVIDHYQTHCSSHIFKLDLPANIDRTVCLIDRYRINQVLENLLSNATKYSPKGSEIQLRCRFNETQWEISVADQGIGMNAEQLAKVFDKFYRAHATDSSVSGLGLGMSIARQIVECHGGRIWVESAEGIGTTASFTLPHIVA